jgi:hypothetical protein
LFQCDLVLKFKTQPLGTTIKMDYTTLIISAITMPIIIALYWYLSKKNKEAPSEQNGIKILSVHKFFFYFGIIIPLLGFALLISPLTLINDPEFLMIIMMIYPIGLLLVASGLFYFVEYKNARIEYDETKISITNFNKKVTQIDIMEIKTVSHNSLMNRIKITTTNNSKSFNQNFKGVVHLLDTITAQSGISTEKVKQKINVFNFG